MPRDQKTVFLHVGCRKSGTSALQLGLRRAADELRDAGLEQPLGGRGGTMAGLLTPLRGDEETGRAAVAKLADKVRNSPHPRHLVTLEALAELPAEATSLVVEGLAEFDTRVIITARPWALTIPSEWQQRVKGRFTGEYADYARAVRNPESASGVLAQEASDFHPRQDVADVARRWRAADPDLPVHVILVPQGRETRPSLTEMFCQVVGIEPQAIAIPDRLVNPSLSHEDAEVLRLVNLALGNRLQNKRGNYRHSVRKWIAVGSMMDGSKGSKIRLPRELESWASEEAARQIEELRSEGCELLGDPEGFIRPSLGGDDLVPPTDAQVARAAAAVLADLAQGHARQRRRAAQRAKAQRAQALRARREARHQVAGPAEKSVRTVPARALRRLRRELVARLPGRGSGPRA